MKRNPIVFSDFKITLHNKVIFFFFFKAPFAYFNSEIVLLVLLCTGWPESGHLDRCVSDNSDVCWTAGRDCSGRPTGGWNVWGVEESTEWQPHLRHWVSLILPQILFDFNKYKTAEKFYFKILQDYIVYWRYFFSPVDGECTGWI